MTGQRMTAEREAQLRYQHRAHALPGGSRNWCFGCGESVAEGGHCQVTELLDALAAERAHTQDVRNAWVIPGRNPEFHKYVKDWVRRYWPTMYRALDQLTRTQA